MMNLTNKKLISKILFPVLLFCLLISACDNVINKSVISEQDDMVLVYFRSSNLSMRSVLPDISKNDLISYKLYGATSTNLNQKETLLAEFYNINNASIYIRPVSWNFTMEAYDSNGYIMFRGTRKNVNITAGYSEAVNFSLIPVYGYSGSALIIIELPDETFVDSVEVTLDEETLDSPPEIENGIIRFFIEKDAGNYLVNFFFKDSEGRVLAVKTEILVIRSRLQSVKTITLTDDDFNVPAAPINVEIDSVSTIKVYLSWDSVNIANSFNIYRSESTDGIYKKINTIVVNETKFTDTSVTPDTAYLYKISSINGDIEGVQSAPLRVNTLSSIPVNVRVISRSTVSLNFAWDVVEEAIGYNIYRFDTEHGTYEKINTAVETETEFTDTGVLPDRNYYYIISAVFNDFEGLRSEPISVTTLSSIPANVQVSSRSTIRINLAWNSVENANNYNIYRSDTEHGTYEKINTTLVTGTGFTNTDLLPDRNYYYKISAVFNDFEGLQSTPLHINTLSSVPANFKYTSVLATKINLVWSFVVDASSYNIYRSNNYNGIYNKINNDAVTGNGFTDTELYSSTTYYYKISAVFNDFVGLESSPLSVTTISSTISIIDFSNPADPVLQGMPEKIIQTKKESCTIKVIKNGAGWANSYKWYLNGIVKNVTGDSFIIDWNLPVGSYELTVVATRDNVPYSTSAKFKVVNN